MKPPSATPQTSREIMLPPKRTRADGQVRRLGIELEMNGLTIDRLAQLVSEFLDGDVEQASRYERAIHGDPAGTWMAELDFDLLKKMGREDRDQDSLIAEIEQSTEDVLAWLAETVVPVELVSPPIPFDRLKQMEKLVDHLREHGALGTSDKLTNAFGLHLNPEMPDLEANTVTAILKAFFCLYDWLVERATIDMTRRMTTYIDPFPMDYIKRVVQPDYWPGRNALIDDYLEDNPTRNRALDMLPLFAYLDEARVRQTTDDPRIKSRPALHYRLPNCDIHLPEWGLYHAWNDWVMVEKLAADHLRLHQCCEAYQGYLNSTVDRLLGDWQKELEKKWLYNL